MRLESLSEIGCAPIRTFCSGFLAKTQADVICGCDSDCHRAVIFTGALPVLQALKSGDLSDVRVVLGHLSEDKLYCSGYHLIVVYLGDGKAD